MFDSLPEHLKERLPETMKDEARGVEIVTIDGQTFERAIPRPMTSEFMARIMAAPLNEDSDEG